MKSIINNILQKDDLGRGDIVTLLDADDPADVELIRERGERFVFLEERI